MKARWSVTTITGNNGGDSWYSPARLQFPLHMTRDRYAEEKEKAYVQVKEVNPANPKCSVYSYLILMRPLYDGTIQRYRCISIAFTNLV